MTPARRHLVLGIGNTLNTDEGVGVHAVALLKEALGNPLSIEFLDGGTLGLNLLPLVEEAQHLVLLDAVNAGAQGGTVIELRRDEIPLFAGVRMSQHQLTFQEVLGLAQVRGKLPAYLHLIGVQPEDLSVGVGLSVVVAKAVPRVLNRAEAVLREWNLLNDQRGA